MKKRRILLALLALCLALTAITGSAWAYFTTNTSAAGGQTLRLGSSTTVDEDMNGWTKQVTITNSGEVPVYVRARVFSQYRVDCTSSTGWTLNTSDNYWYYNEILTPGQAAAVFNAAIQSDNGVTGAPTLPSQGGEAFDVTVVYETTPVQYQADGTPYANWDLKLQPTTDSQGGDNA